MMADRTPEHTQRKRNSGNDLLIFNIMDELTNEHPLALDEPFPETWTDPLELYGCYRESLESREMDLNQERDAIRDLMKDDQVSPTTIWHTRLGLVAERIVTRRH